MSGKIIPAVTAAILLGSTALASAQAIMVAPQPYDSYYGVPVITFGFGVMPAYSGYGPVYYGYAPGYYYDSWNDRWDWQ